MLCLLTNLPSPILGVPKTGSRYHNSVHAADVTQAIGYFIMQVGYMLPAELNHVLIVFFRSSSPLCQPGCNPDPSSTPPPPLCGLPQQPFFIANITSVEVFGSLVAAMIHDFAHPGSDLVLVYWE